MFNDLITFNFLVYDRDAVNQKSDDETIQPSIENSSSVSGNVNNNKEVQKRTQVRLGTKSENET